MRTFYLTPVISSSSFFFFVPRLFSPVAYCIRLPYFHTWCGLSANLECRSQMCCMRLAENTGRKKSPKISHLCTIAQLCRAISSQLRLYISTIGKKLVKQQYLLHMFSQYGELRSIIGWERFTSLGHPSKFQPFSRFGRVTAATSLNGRQSNFARCLVVSWAVTLYIHFGGLLPPNGILPGAKLTLHPSPAFSCFGSVAAGHSSSGNTGLGLYTRLQNGVDRVSRLMRVITSPYRDNKPPRCFSATPPRAPQ